MRIVTDPQAASLAAKHASADDIAHLEAALQRIRDADAGLDDSLDADIAFFTALFESTDNRYFIQLTDFVSTALRVTSRYANRLQGFSINNLAMYEAVFDAIVQGNSMAAFSLIRNMLDDMMKTVLVD